MNRRQFLQKSLLSLFWGAMGFHTHAVSAACVSSTDKRLKTPHIALIIDDIGFSRSRADAFFRIAAPLTFAVLPRLTFSERLALEAHERGREVMLHQPMEPFNAELDPGPGAVYIKDAPDKIAATLRRNLSELPFIVGVNNHMGSRFTSSPEKMTQLLPLVKTEGLFFIDSLTSGSSKAFSTAQQLHIPSASRNVFLDNRREESEILGCLNRLVRVAKVHGKAIGIGHPYPETSRAVARFVNHTGPKPYKLVPVSDILGALPT